MAKKKQYTKEEIEKRKLRELAKATRQLKANSNISTANTEGAELVNYIVKKFELVFLQEYILKKLYQINEGTYKGLMTPIPYKDLLEMFKFYDKDVTAGINKLKAQGADKVNMVSYCIAIILSKANEFYERASVLRGSNEDSVRIAQEHMANKKVMEAINKTVEAHNKEEEKLDLSELMNFGYDEE